MSFFPQFLFQNNPNSLAVLGKICYNKSIKLPRRYGNYVELSENQAKRLEDFVDLVHETATKTPSQTKPQTNKTKSETKTQTKTKAETKTETVKQDGEGSDNNGGSDNDK